jgi:hypothetical protein
MLLERAKKERERVVPGLRFLWIVLLVFGICRAAGIQSKALTHLPVLRPVSLYGRRR